MKKLLTLTLLSFIFSLSAKSQSNIILSLTDKVEKGYFKTRNVFNASISGFSSKEESNKFYNYLKSNGDVKSIEVFNPDARGNSNIKLTMKAFHDKKYFIVLATKLNVGYIEINGEKKTVEAMMNEINSKKKY